MAFRESFEGLKHEPNSPFFGGYFVPGSESEFPFGTGLSLVHPIPNEDADVLVVDFGAPKAIAWDLGPNGVITAADVPAGKAFIGLHDADHDAFIRFDLNTTAYQVSANVNSADDIVIIAYDAKGRELGAAQVSSVEHDVWNQNFISVASKEPIHSIAFYGTDVVIDQVFFTAARPTTVNFGGDGYQGPPTHLAEDPLILRGSQRPDEMSGGKAGDTIYGHKGRDKIFAGAGDDLIIGNRGKDILWGESGQDTFMFKKLHTGVDRIRDFDPEDDTVFLAGPDFAGVDPGRLDEKEFSDGAVTKATRVHYDTETGELTFITPGPWSRPVVFARLDPGLELGASDFLVA